MRRLRPTSRPPAALALAAVLAPALPAALPHALGAQALYELSQRYPNPVRRLMRFGVRVQLPRGYDIDTHFSPHYDPWDERMCAVPGGDLFKAIKSGRAEVVTDHIETFTETGIRLRSGRELEADVIVSATGLELLFLGGMVLLPYAQPDLELAGVWDAICSAAGVPKSRSSAACTAPGCGNGTPSTRGATHSAIASQQVSVDSGL